MPKIQEKESILVFAAHNDDQIIGVGGTIAKYAKENKNIIVYIFSFGESSHPHFQKREIIKTRVKEMHESDKVLKIDASYYLGLKEGAFIEEFEAKNKKDIIIRAIKNHRPVKMFTHSKDDPHPDHKAVNEIIRKVTKEINYEGELFSFDVWNPFSIRGRNRPKLIVDITETFPLKVKALKCHESQFTALVSMLPSMYARAIVNGLRYGCRYAEKFTKIH
ncbi:hypothetical protein COV15_01585 [Candidatus Woesearchaeota archaeon CG10_big_fil_rev_8_21_14_0_10_34_12]|nr:MAG: hypothetical protein COV15_01585 [Candidatus Woesearchaeota archaeon CG10_big_fil_rev_8_21_14_0_10_34_12]